MRDTQTGTSTAVNVDKDRYLVVAIHQIMEEYGWNSIENHFGVNYHNIVFTKPHSSLEKVELKAQVIGNHLDISFLGVSDKKGVLDKFFDFNVREIPKKFDLNKYVSDEMKILNQQRLRNAVGIVIKELEDSAKK